ncbi:GDSL-like Lipase/Acylhydrolase superfamily protein isoform 1 [Hibiscus syriacus]|uniref:GDSL-like Lipase/Acylhydrolase superfamily protein isoform 1 n=1 Tax=Hibiscus syriacus TaxID=106335 RepID=A0A6A3C1X8_HIBSY|nr:protein KINESIN LIGHT CHAIN-RELATED 2-like [Hibiscus syriacus]KAE8722021.1 GDSL-like Lipase/Acylhydrolase superfamily protein isoform 1 [Hibiscus syriacus]
MPGLTMDAMNGETRIEEHNKGFYLPYKDIFTQERSPRSALSPRSDSLDLAIDGVVSTSIEQLYHNVYAMQSSDQSSSMSSYGSYGEESRIDSELRHLIGDFGVVEMTKEVQVAEKKEDEDSVGGLSIKKENVVTDKMPVKKNNDKIQTQGGVRHRPHLHSHFPVLERSIEIPVIEDGQTHALAKFAGCMHLGDTYAMLGQIENSILCYTAGLEIQKQVLGDTDPRVGETCRYVAEAHVQALWFDEAEKLCQMALDIHRENGAPASFEEAADRRLMGLICDLKEDYGSALEHYVLASMAMATNGCELNVASIDCSIGDAYLSLARVDETVFAFQKALTVFKSAKGENHPSVALVFVRLADLYNKVGKLRDSRTYCENALRIYAKPNPGIPLKEIASGLIDIVAICQSMNGLDHALKLLKKVLSIFSEAPGKQTTIAGIEAQMGVMYYMMGSYADSYNTFKSAISKFRASGEKKSALFGIALNQMGLACIQRYSINEAADLFEEARSILEKEYGPYHPHTLGVYSNLAGTYDAMGRLDEAIEILDYVVDMREEKLGTANPDVIDEKRRLSELLKEAGKVRSRKSRALVTLLDTSTQIIKDDVIKVSKSCL